MARSKRKPRTGRSDPGSRAGVGVIAGELANSDADAGANANAFLPPSESPSSSPSIRPESPRPIPSAPELSRFDRFLGSWKFVVPLLSLHFVLAMSAIGTKSLTSDELAHIPAGISYWRFRDYRMNPEHPSLPKLWGTLPSVFMNLNWREDDPFWIRSRDWVERTRDLSAIRPHATEIERSIKAEWDLGQMVLYRWNRTKLASLVFQCHFMMTLVSVAGAFLAWFWATLRFGPRAAATALVLYALCPNILAHAPIVHTDVPAMVSNVACLMALFRFLSSDRPLTSARSAADIAFMSLWLGVTLLCKHSQLVVVGFAGLAMIVFAFDRPRGGRLAWFGSKVAGGLLAGVGALAVLELHHRVFFGSSFVQPWIGGILIVRARLAYAFDARFYLLGEIAPRFPHYFLVAIGVKATLGALALMLVGFGRGALGWSAALRDSGAGRSCVLPLERYLVLYVVFFLTFISIQFPNMGVRHALPIFPPLFLLAGSAVQSWTRRPGFAGAVIGALALHAVSTLAAWPNYISYMNAITARQGKFHFLSDSNLDWGQDFPALARRLREMGVPSVRSRFLSSCDPAYYGVTATPVVEDADLIEAPSGTVLVQSTHFLQGGPQLLEFLDSEWIRVGTVNETLVIHRRP